jgi:uncharacterized cupin superfamily protein
MSVNKAAIDSRAVGPVSKTGYPEPYRSQVMPREKRQLGDAFGLTKIGINRTTLAPGKVSSMCHWHTAEDEFIYMLEGEVVLRTTSSEQVISAGMCVGFPAAGVPAGDVTATAAPVEEGHQLINRSAHPAVYLEISNRDDEDTAYYTDAAVDLIASPPHARGRMTRKDGTPYEEPA